jgi:hypothetical protein
MMLLQYEQAAEDCDKAIALTPDNAKLYFRKGKALASMVRASMCALSMAPQGPNQPVMNSRIDQPIPPIKSINQSINQSLNQDPPV